MTTHQVRSIAGVITFVLGGGVGPSWAECPPIPPSQYMKNTFEVGVHDPFAVPGIWGVVPGWVKFTILTCDAPYDEATPVYYQDTREYAFHYDFGVEHLSPIFGGMDPAAYDAATLHAAGQLGILGTVLLPANSDDREYAVQFIRGREDPYPRETIRDLFAAVRASIVAGPDWQAYYFPTLEQADAAEADREWFAQQDPPILLGSVSRWTTRNPIYSPGWALGRLKYFPWGQIDSAYQSGLLEPGDILLTDGIPAEVPHVAGILSLAAATPNSHVSILANTFGMPFVHLAEAADVQRAGELEGRMVVLRAYERWSGKRVRLIDAEHLSAAQVDEILQLKEPPVLNLAVVAPYGAYSAPTDGLLPGDIRHFGGKAANYGMLRRAIPAQSPAAVALSFDLWSEFVGQTMPGGATLRAEIDARLANHPTYPPDVAALANDLDWIRERIKDDTAISPGLAAAVITVLQDPQYGFDPNAKIRFRSSTNMEDAEQFTGAGLYDSYSGCLADDLDGDTVGPSICDPSKDKERGVFRALRKVFASFYNDNAVLERLRHGVEEDDVGMAILVHHSFPDEFELANGVATYTKTVIDGSSQWVSRRVALVTQHGAHSVTNPDPGEIAEEIDVYVGGTAGQWTIHPHLMRWSNLVPLGTYLLDWEDEYVELTEYVLAAGEEFEAVTGKDSWVLDFEYKKLAPGGAAMPGGGLVVKQIRELPQPSDVPSITPCLINEPTEYVINGRYTDGFPSHRLKSRWRLETPDMWLTPANLAGGLITEASLLQLEDCTFDVLSGPMAGWPAFAHAYADGVVTDGWMSPGLVNPRTFTLTVRNIPELVAPSESPVLTLRDFGNTTDSHYDACWLDVQVDYQDPVVVIGPEGPEYTTTDEITIWRDYVFDEPWLEERVIETEFEGQPLRITARFLARDVEETRVLVRWDETVIEGLTGEPIVLLGNYAQTFAPGRHNFSEVFLFEPRLEPGLPVSQLAELAARDIRLLHVATLGSGMSYYSIDVTAFGFDGSTCPLCGDLDDDGDVDGDDADLLDVLLGVCLGEAGYAVTADLDGDGCVTAADQEIWPACRCDYVQGHVGDYDGSGAVDLADFASWPACATGPGGSLPVEACGLFDADCDGDADLRDFGRLQGVLGGE